MTNRPVVNIAAVAQILHATTASWMFQRAGHFVLIVIPHGLSNIATIKIHRSGTNAATCPQRSNTTNIPITYRPDRACTLSCHCHSHMLKHHPKWHTLCAPFAHLLARKSEAVL